MIKDIFGYRQLGVREGKAFGEFYATGYQPKFLERLKASGIVLPETLFAERILPPLAGARRGEAEDGAAGSPGEEVMGGFSSTNLLLLLA